MKEASAAAQLMARRLLDRKRAESGSREPADIGAHLALRAIQKLGLHLSKLVGDAGFQVLLARALALAKAENHWLESVRVSAEGHLEGYEETIDLHTPESAEQGSEALLAHLIGLLQTFIGEDLTARMLADVWPNAAQSTQPPHKTLNTSDAHNMPKSMSEVTST